MEKINNNTNELEIIIVKVNEEINKAHIKEFILTSISQKGKSANKEDHIAYFYIPKISSYEIIIYKNRNHPLFFVHTYFMKNPSKDAKVLVFDNLILLYKDGELYYLQKIDYELSKDEITQLVYKKASIIVNSIEFLSYKDIENLKLDKKQINKNIKMIRKNNYNHTLIYTFYTLLSFILISFYIYTNNFSNEKLQKIVSINQMELKNLIDSRKRDFEIVRIVDIMKNVKKLSLELIELTFENNNYSLILENSDEKELYLFVNRYKKRVQIKKLQYIKERQTYELHVQIANN